MITALSEKGAPGRSPRWCNALLSAAAVAVAVAAAVVLTAAATAAAGIAAAAGAEAAAGEQKNENDDDPETGIVTAHCLMNPFSAQMILISAFAVRDDLQSRAALARPGAERLLLRLHHIMLPPVGR